MCVCSGGWEGIVKRYKSSSSKNGKSKGTFNEKIQEVETCINMLHGDTEVNTKRSSWKIQSSCHLEAASGMVEA